MGYIPRLAAAVHLTICSVSQVLTIQPDGVVENMSLVSSSGGVELYVLTWGDARSIRAQAIETLRGRVFLLGLMEG